MIGRCFNCSPSTCPLIYFQHLIFIFYVIQFYFKFIYCMYWWLNNKNWSCTARKKRGKCVQNVVLGCQLPPSSYFSTNCAESGDYKIYFLDQCISTCLWMMAKLSRALFNSSSTTFGSSTVRFSLNASRTLRRAYVLQKQIRSLNFLHLLAHAKFITIMTARESTFRQNFTAKSSIVNSIVMDEAPLLTALQL